MSDDETFESTDAGASLTFPVQAGNVKKGDVVLLDGFPCKVVDMSTSKTGKHGHAKAHVIGLDIFEGKKHEEVCPSSHNMQGVVMKRTEYKIMDIQADQLTLMLDDGSMKEDLDLPKDADLADKIRKAHEGGDDVSVVVITAMNREAVVSFKDDSGRK
mmetsp:Transcript_3925/g.5097  ORF Transcript_3925/g.5097 Transcript_3925/m.5097 type:complete len:158 (+) Transcript_3925:41-514(+)|eukprot:CAMPEP_0201479416 /NCGR_PEP_ID=MMETSP0151_2-20130828/4121_1 /ASSEMBLY_ACC=CAM_ASM_000257 /TAXON_ID=200890 /ORGANISM="Paramoeba atlantica, Strain 621/1 / CCAP 1560/9" /LENGTH=157 /DNA_ID=CAMNT_0047860899 /DNA_START=58 /DNA_END=531 /DNA_ORIENTATION=+